jgi:transcriptional regulator with XRE-family HTH domain
MNYELAAQIRAKKMGVLLRDARIRAGESMKSCGDILGTTGRMISKYEDGEKSPSLPELEVLAYFLDVPLDQFWGDRAKSEKDKLKTLGDIEQRLKIRDLKIGALLRKTRKEKDLSMTEVSEKLGITTYRLKSYETGKFSVPIAELEALLEIYEIELEDFFSDSGPIAEWSSIRRTGAKFDKLPEDLREFVTKPINQPYLELAQKLSELSADRLRDVAEGLLDITL